MNKYISRGLYCALFVGGLSLLGATAANAADTTGEDGLVSGEQVGISVTAPVTATGNAISVVGDSGSSGAATPAPPVAAAPAAATTSGEDGTASGIQAFVDASAPVTVGGNAISVIGDSSSSGSETGSPTAPSGSASAPTTNGEDSLAGGNQIAPDGATPVTVGGNAISVIGNTESSGSTTETTPAGGTTESTTTGDDSVAGGNQITPLIAAPIDLSGNSVSVVGDSTSSDPPATAAPTNPATGVTGVSVTATPPAPASGVAGVSVTATPPAPATGVAGVSVTATSDAATGFSLAALSALALTGADNSGFGALAGGIAMLAGILLVGARRLTVRL